jgi:F-type H+-transporting ATPase subunit b
MEAKVKAAADKINLKIDSAQAQVRTALDAARSEIEAVAAEATREMVSRLTGLAVDGRDAAAAVKAELNV